jgi:hypothetical protein
MTIRIDELDTTAIPQRDHEFPAMRDGITVKLTAAQILALIQKGDLSADVLASLDLADSALQTLQPREDIASATTTDIGAAASQYLRVTGTTTITGLGTATAGTVRDVLFEGALTLTHNATSLILPGGTDITTAAGDTALFRSEGSGNWRCVRYQRAAGTALLGGVDGTTTITRTGGTNSTLLVSAIAKAWANLNGTGTIALRGSLNISSVVDNGTGDYTFNWSSAMTDANYALTAQSSGSSGFFLFVSSRISDTKTASAYRVVVVRNDVGDTDDPTFVNAAIHGDLA